MNKPDEVDCRACRRWYWYGGSCSAHSYDEDLGIDPMCPESIEDCEYFEIKLHSEYTAEHYDPLPSLETVELVRRIRNTEYDDLVKRIQNSCQSPKLKETQE